MGSAVGEVVGGFVTTPEVEAASAGVGEGDGDALAPSFIATKICISLGSEEIHISPDSGMKCTPSGCEAIETSKGAPTISPANVVSTTSLLS